MNSCRPAFTLLEIILVVMIIGIIAMIALPRLNRQDPSTTIEAVAEEFNNLVYFTRQEAISNHKRYRLHFTSKRDGADSVQVEIEGTDPEKPNQQIFNPVTSSAASPTFYSIPETVKLEALFHGKEDELTEKNHNGFCHIIPDGLVENVLIHVTYTRNNQEEKWSLKVSPFFGKFDLSQGFIKPEKQ